MTNGFAAFARAVGWGTVAGAAPYTVLFIIPLAIAGLDYRSLGETALVLAYPLMLSGAIVLGSAVVLGLPLTMILSGTDLDRSRTYAVAGMLLGAFVPAAIVTAMAGEIGEASLFFALPGTLAGLVTGTIWGRWREALNR